jgi:6-phosphogluconolactonase/glucosamine-6-phosphate isomerase/deaminase
MATGSTPLGLYQELVRLPQAGEVDFSRVTTFNLDALQLHRDAAVIVDEEAAAGLTMRDYYEFIYAAKPAAPRS